MQIIQTRADGSAREVELNHREVVADEFFNELLDLGLGVQAAADRVAKFGRRTTKYSDEFLAWLVA